ncbi:MAG: hypothetical protein FJZ13_05905 [Candidatus Omnitrophica bacterium]|nr:hypothetical protein [Candidatus Omnitrophota bacterium]
MKRRLLVLCGVIFVTSFFLGCDQINSLLFPKPAPKKQALAPEAQVRGTIIAKVNNIPITLEELNAEIDAYNSLMAANDKPEAKITTREQKIDYLKNELLRRTLLYQQALDKGIDRNQEVLAVLEKYKRELLVIELLKEETEKVDVASREIEDYYNTYKDQLKEPEERELREIMVPTEQEAKETMVQLLQGADFATLAKERSKAASSARGGDLGFTKQGVKSAQFDEVAFAASLDVGKISNIFRGPDGYYILKLEAKRGGKLRSLSEMWDDIKKGLTFLKQQKSIDDLIAKLSRDSKIEIREGEIK